MRLKQFLYVVEEPFQKNFLPYKQMWSRRHNTSTFLLLASGSLCKLEFLLNSSLHWTWEKCILLKRAEPGSGAMGTPSGLGESGSFPGTCCQCLCCSFGAAFSLLFSGKFFGFGFFYCFSSSLFLVVNDKEKKEMWSCALRSLPFYPPQVTGNGGVMAILVLHTL